jgi:glycosyltransferase involved in cell wall biosynthesis
VGATVGGSHLSALLLARHLPAPYKPVIVVHEEGPLINHLQREGIPCSLLPLPEYVGGGSTIADHARAVVRTHAPVRQFIRQEGITFIHANDGKMNQTWGLPARLAGVAFIWHQRTLHAPSRLTETLLRVPQRIVCSSRFTAERLPPACRDRIKVIENPFDGCAAPIDRALAQRRLLAELEAAPETRIIGFFGNLAAQKRPLLFVQTIARLRERRPSLRLAALVFGERRDDWDARMLASAAEAGITDSLRFMGFRHPVTDWMAVCDLVLCPGINEGFGRTVVESMLAGTPVVAARSGGHLEIISDGENGLLPAHDDADGFADAAIRLLEDGDLATEIAERAQAHARSHYSVQAHVAQMAAIYDELIFNKP